MAPSSGEFSDEVVIRPGDFGLENDFIPVRLFSNDIQRNLLGCIDYSSEKLSAPPVFKKVALGFLFKMPKEISAGQKTSYLIQWGKLVKFGWQDEIKVDEVSGIGGSTIANYSYYIESFLDSNLRYWRSYGKATFAVPGVAVSKSGYIHSQATNFDGKYLSESLIDFKPASFKLESGTYTGTSFQFFPAGPISFIETLNELWALWNAEEYSFISSRDIRKIGLGFQRFNKNNFLP